MRSRTLIAMPIAAAVAVGAAGLAIAANEPGPARPMLIRPAPMAIGPAGLAGPLGFDKELASELATELGLPADKVTAAMRKVIETRLNRHRDAILKCFDEGKPCKPRVEAFGMPPIELPPIPFPRPEKPKSP